MKKNTIAYWLLVRIPFWTIAASVAVVTLLRWVPVTYTPLMLKRAFQFRDEETYHSEQKWVSLEDISPELIGAVIAAEDQKFYSHHGFDWEELGGMWREHRQAGAPVRGCSTISQQTAKNVFTLATRTWARKAAEAYWTCLIETIWGKERILEVYLNVVETGKGLYGVEAASEYYFGKTAKELDLRQSVSMAVCFPSPLTVHPDYLPSEIRIRYAQVIGQMTIFAAGYATSRRGNSAGCGVVVDGDGFVCRQSESSPGLDVGECDPPYAGHGIAGAYPLGRYR